MKIHYFESNFNQRGRLISSTYNCFDMQEDFVDMIRRCQEIIPSAKHELIERMEKLIKIANRMPPEDDSKPQLGSADIEKQHAQLKADRAEIDKKLEKLSESIKENIAKQEQLCNESIAKMMAKKEALLARANII